MKKEREIFLIDFQKIVVTSNKYHRVLNLFFCTLCISRGFDESCSRDKKIDNKKIQKKETVRGGLEGNKEEKKERWLN